MILMLLVMGIDAKDSLTYVHCTCNPAIIKLQRFVCLCRADDAIYQLLGIGRPYANVEPFSFQCRPGLQPIGFGARSSCYSIVDFQV